MSTDQIVSVGDAGDGWAIGCCLPGLRPSLQSLLKLSDAQGEVDLLIPLSKQSRYVGDLRITVSASALVHGVEAVPHCIRTSKSIGRSRKWVVFSANTCWVLAEAMPAR